MDPSLAATPEEGFWRSQAHGGFGTIMRCRHADHTEGYVAFKIGGSVGHFDCDEGSLVWYAFGQPLLTDFGCQYNPNLHAHPWLHSRISIDHAADGAPRGGRLLAARFVPGLDWACGEVRVHRLYREAEWPVRERSSDFRVDGEPERDVAEHCWRRHLLYAHELEALVLLDTVAGPLPTDWNLQVLADAARIDGNRVVLRGQHGIDLHVCLAEPASPNWEIAAFAHQGFDEPRLPMGWWRAAAWTAPKGVSLGPMGERALTGRAHAERGGSYLAVLLAVPQGEAAPEVTWGPGPELCVSGRRGRLGLHLGQAGEAWQAEVSGQEGTQGHELPVTGGPASG